MDDIKFQKAEKLLVAMKTKAISLESARQVAVFMQENYFNQFDIHYFHILLSLQLCNKDSDRSLIKQIEKSSESASSHSPTSDQT